MKEEMVIEKMEECVDCPMLSLVTDTVYADNKPLYKVRRCEHLDFCQKVREHWEKHLLQKGKKVGRCKHCKYYPRNPRSYYDNDEICTYVMCGRLDGGEDGFCSNYKPLGERREE